MSFGSRLKDVRINALHMQQKELAAQEGISAVVLSHYENDKREPSLDFIRSFCERNHVSADYLFELSDNLQHSAPISISPVVVSRDPLGDLLPGFREQAESYLAFLRQQQKAQVEAAKEEA